MITGKNGVPKQAKQKEARRQEINMCGAKIDDTVEHKFLR
jgi:hypothetical protein